MSSTFPLPPEETVPYALLNLHTNTYINVFNAQPNAGQPLKSVTAFDKADHMLWFWQIQDNTGYVGELKAKLGIGFLDNVLDGWVGRATYSLKPGMVALERVARDQFMIRLLKNDNYLTLDNGKDNKEFNQAVFTGRNPDKTDKPDARQVWKFIRAI